MSGLSVYDRTMIANFTIILGCVGVIRRRHLRESDLDEKVNRIGNNFLSCTLLSLLGHFTHCLYKNEYKKPSVYLLIGTTAVVALTSGLDYLASKSGTDKVKKATEFLDRNLAKIADFAFQIVAIANVVLLGQKTKFELNEEKFAAFALGYNYFQFMRSRN